MKPFSIAAAVAVVLSFGTVAEAQHIGAIALPPATDAGWWATDDLVRVPRIRRFTRQNQFGPPGTCTLLALEDVTADERTQKLSPTTQICLDTNSGSGGVFLYTTKSIDGKVNALNSRVDVIENKVLASLKELTADDKLKAMLDDLTKRIEELEAANELARSELQSLKSKLAPSANPGPKKGQQ
jgi:hypothetical protein